MWLKIHTNKINRSVLGLFSPFLQALKELLYAIFWSESKENFQLEIFNFNLHKGCLIWLKLTLLKKGSIPDLVQVDGQIIGGRFTISCILVKRFDWWYVKSAKNLRWSYLVYSQIWLNLVMKYHQFNYITKLRKKHTHTHHQKESKARKKHKMIMLMYMNDNKSILKIKQNKIK